MQRGTGPPLVTPRALGVQQASSLQLALVVVLPRSVAIESVCPSQIPANATAAADSGARRRDRLPRTTLRRKRYVMRACNGPQLETTAGQN